MVRLFFDDYNEILETISANDVRSVAMLRTSPLVVGIMISARARVPESVPFR